MKKSQEALANALQDNLKKRKLQSRKREQSQEKEPIAQIPVPNAPDAKNQNPTYNA